MKRKKIIKWLQNSREAITKLRETVSEAEEQKELWLKREKDADSTRQALLWQEIEAGELKKLRGLEAHAAGLEERLGR